LRANIPQALFSKLSLLAGVLFEKCQPKTKIEILMGESPLRGGILQTKLNET
jgi:hypothetical protein